MRVDLLTMWISVAQCEGIHYHLSTDDAASSYGQPVLVRERVNSMYDREVLDRCVLGANDPMPGPDWAGRFAAEVVDVSTKGTTIYTPAEWQIISRFTALRGVDAA